MIQKDNEFNKTTNKDKNNINKTKNNLNGTKLPNIVQDKNNNNDNKKKDNKVIKTTNKDKKKEVKVKTNYRFIKKAVKTNSKSINPVKNIGAH